MLTTTNKLFTRLGTRSRWRSITSSSPSPAPVRLSPWCLVPGTPVRFLKHVIPSTCPFSFIAITEASKSIFLPHVHPRPMKRPPPLAISSGISATLPFFIKKVLVVLSTRFPLSATTPGSIRASTTAWTALRLSRKFRPPQLLPSSSQPQAAPFFRRRRPKTTPVSLKAPLAPPHTDISCSLVPEPWLPVLVVLRLTKAVSSFAKVEPQKALTKSTMAWMLSGMRGSSRVICSLAPSGREVFFSPECFTLPSAAPRLL
mmetsp:Transcript_7567/g.17813  ORF Transcript_7567/g.17813 Transcript_7567/m.17813 type:complete len:258 (-) Transcript_7567:224-997(-)